MLLALKIIAALFVLAFVAVVIITVFFTDYSK
jgi:hypothetical protein